ncbi:MAG: helix-turn-helix transcriptional regulator [Desulfobacterota bacterium]|jgi:DNA-binding CsgD family transcriptional regulator|nr:helix-turn-helix transcriptional regulator [Thermodesulfobacteriota bacterium]
MGRSTVTFDLESGARSLKNRGATEKLPGALSYWNRALLSFPPDNLPAGIALLDRDFILRRRNQQYADYLRLYSPLGPDRALGRCYFDYMPGSRGQLEEWFRETRDCGRCETRLDYPLRLTYPAGEKVTYWNASLTALSARPSRVEGILIFCVDVTPGKQAFQVLQDQQAELERRALELREAKTALRVLQDLREEDKTELERRLTANARNLILPDLHLLKTGCPEKTRQSVLKRLEANLEEIVSPFSRRLQTAEYRLTPKEIRIANLIREGRTSKEIAQLLCLSTAGIDFHRNNIRKKLGINQKKQIGLREHLLALEPDHP